MFAVFSEMLFLHPSVILAPPYQFPRSAVLSSCHHLGGAIQSIFQPWRPATQTHIWINFVFHIILKRRAAYPKLWQLHLICIRSMPHQRRAAATNTFRRGSARQKIQHDCLVWKICPSFPTICRLLYRAQDDRQSKRGVGGWR